MVQRNKVGDIGSLGQLLRNVVFAILDTLAKNVKVRPSGASLSVGQLGYPVSYVKMSWICRSTGLGCDDDVAALEYARVAVVVGVVVLSRLGRLPLGVPL